LNVSLEETEYTLPTGIICAFVKRFCKPFYQYNDLHNRYTEDSDSSSYDGGKNRKGEFE